MHYHYHVNPRRGEGGGRLERNVEVVFQRENAAGGEMEWLNDYAKFGRFSDPDAVWFFTPNFRALITRGWRRGRWGSATLEHLHFLARRDGVRGEVELLG